MKRIWSMLLVFLMLISSTAYAEETGETETTQNITAYLSVSKYGEIVESKDDVVMAYVPVELTGKESYTLDDLFSGAHALYYVDGALGYASSDGEWGLGVDMFWGDTSYNFGYQVNGGTESVMGLAHEVENGDYVDACIYQSLYPDTEGYAAFDTQNKAVYAGEAARFTLTYASGYDENWNTVYAPCEGATMILNGEATEITTNENGEAEIVLEEPGRYVISAKKTKSVQNAEVTAITAPVCVLEVLKNPAIEIIHNIAQAYTQMNFEDAGGNLPWILADMAVYSDLFPESEIGFTQEQKTEGLEKIVAFAKEATRPGDLAKAILALRSLGYDARQIYTADYQNINVVKKLIKLVEEQDEAVTDMYTLPYVIIALSQAEDYASTEQMQTLIQAAVANKTAWQDVTEGTDAMTPMLLALAPFGADNDVLKESVAILIKEQREDGLIDGFPGYEPASTGLAICALSAVGMDAAEVKKEGHSLIDGLLSTANEAFNGFSNAFATEQGFRGLLSWRLLLENSGNRMYDFSELPMEEVNLSGVEYCPVVFHALPQGVSVTINGKTQLASQVFDLPEGSYTYVASAPGYYDKTDAITVTEEDAKERIVKNISVSLAQIYSGGVGGTVNKKPEKEEEEREEKPVLTEETFPDVNKEDWYYPAVSYVYENKLFGGTENGFEPAIPMTRGMLVTVLYRMEAPKETMAQNLFTDVNQDAWYAAGVAWAAECGIVQGISNKEFAPDANISREQLVLILYRYAKMKQEDLSASEVPLDYADIENLSDYAEEAMCYAVQNGIISGKGDGILAPKESASRAEVATMLMRFTEVIK